MATKEMIRGAIALVSPHPVLEPEVTAKVNRIKDAIGLRGRNEIRF